MFGYMQDLLYCSVQGTLVLWTKQCGEKCICPNRGVLVNKVYCFGVSERVNAIYVQMSLRNTKRIQIYSEKRSQEAVVK